MWTCGVRFQHTVNFSIAVTEVCASRRYAVVWMRRVPRCVVASLITSHANLWKEYSFQRLACDCFKRLDEGNTTPEDDGTASLPKVSCVRSQKNGVRTE